MRSNSYDGAFDKETHKVEKRKGKFLKRLSNMFRHSIHGTQMAEFPEFSTNFDTIRNSLAKSESDKMVTSTSYSPSSLDMTDGEIEAEGATRIQISASQDSLDVAEKCNKFRTGLRLPSPQSSFDKGM